MRGAYKQPIVHAVFVAAFDNLCVMADGDQVNEFANGVTADLGSFRDAFALDGTTGIPCPHRKDVGEQEEAASWCG